jgi:ubiquinone/menaquinone biosynthesis C-methylase UbiE
MANESFHNFEREGWSDPHVVQAYASGFGNLTISVIPSMLDAVGAGPGVHLLDVATGPGYVAAEAARRGASVIGVDFAPGMIVEAKRRFPLVDFRVDDALALSFHTESFEAVTANFGLLHYADPDRALQEMYRVLRSGGRAAATVWAAPRIAAGFGIMLDAIDMRGQLNVELPAGPAFFRYSDHGAFHEALVEAGFVEIQVSDFPQTWRLASVDALIAAYEDGTVRTGALLRHQSPEHKQGVHDAIREGAAPYRQPDGSLELPMPCVLAVGRKP